MNKQERTVLVSGVIAGYVTTVLQLSDGPANIFQKARIDFSNRVRQPRYRKDKHTAMLRKSELIPSLQKLTVCGWCLSPYVTLPVYLTVNAILKLEQSKPNQVLGYATATALAAFLRHMGETY